MPGAKQELDIVVRKLPPVRADGRVPVPTPGYVPSGPQVHPPATLNPSQLEGKGAVAETLEIGDRIPIAIAIGDEDEMRRFGEAVHSFLAADRPTLPATERDALAREVLERFGVTGAVEASQLPKATDRLAEWIAAMWPGATWRREWPLLHKLSEGTVLRGVADLVLETDAGLVLLDHKSFPGNREQATARAAEYAGQLSAYAAALEAATSKTVVGTYIHLPVSGLVAVVELSG